MSLFDDEFRKSLLRNQSYLDQQQHLLGYNASWDMTKAMLEGWERQRQRTLGPFADLLDSQRQYRETRERMFASSTTSYLGGMVDALEVARKSLVANDVKRETDQWKTFHDNLVGAARRPEFDRLYQASSLEWQGQLGRLATALDAAARSSAGWMPLAKLAETFAAPAFAYSRFSRQTLAILPAAPPRDVPSLKASLALADQQVSAATSLAVGLIESSSASSGVSIADAGTHEPSGEAAPPDKHEHPKKTVDEVALEANASSITLFGAQQAELIAAGISSDADYDLIINVSPSARSADHARRLITTIIEIQEARLLVGAPDIFSRTVAAMKAIHTLPWLSVNDEMTLGVAVDALYFLVYEGSGDMKRVTAILADPLCEPVWKFKHLRNKWLRHDPQHGQEGDQKKNFNDLREALGYFGCSAKPHTPAAYAALYETLLIRMGGFAEALLVEVLTA